MNPVGAIVKSTVGRLIDRLADRYLPSSMSEKEKEEFRLKGRELALKELEQDIRLIEAVNQTMRAEARSEHFLQWSWRPVVGFTFSLVIINNYVLLPYFEPLGLKPVDIPAHLWNAMLLILGIAAGTRGIEKWQREKGRG